MPTPLGFPDPPDSTRLALVFNWMRQLANAIDTFLRGTQASPTLAANVNVAADGELVVRKRGNTVTLTAEIGLTAAKAAGATLFTIPVGYRPPVKRVPSVSYTSAGTSLVLIKTDGTVSVPFLALSNGHGAFISCTWQLG